MDLNKVLDNCTRVLLRSKFHYSIVLLLQAEFEMKDLGPAQKILGIEIAKER